MGKERETKANSRPAPLRSTGDLPSRARAGGGWPARAGLLGLLLLLLLARAVRAAVDLARFEAQPVSEGGQVYVHLEWETASETDMLGFYVQRSLEEGGPYQRISQLIFAEGGFSGATYDHEDETVAPGETYFYQLEAVETGGHIDIHGPISVLVPASDTATPSPTTRPTSTPTSTPSRTPTRTRTPASTSTNTPVSQPPSSTPPPDPSETATSPSPTPQPTATPAPTEQPTATPTRTATRTDGPKPTVSPTASVTATLTPRPIATPTKTRAPSVTPSPTPTPVLSRTPTLALEAASRTPGPSESDPVSEPTSHRPENPGDGEVKRFHAGWIALAVLLAGVGGVLLLLAGRRMTQREPGT